MRKDYISVVENYISVVEKRIQAHPGRVLAATIVALLASVAVWMGLSNLLMASDEPSLQMVRVYGLTAAAGEPSLEVAVAVNNAGTATAEGCFAKAYNHLLFSEEIDETSELGRSEPFDLPPHSGHVPTVGVDMPNLSGEALLGGGVRAPIFYRTECKNAESFDEGRVVTVSGLPSGS
jgi:hypothetical protein